MPQKACAVFKLITFDRMRDTLVTITQIKAHNARWNALCGKSTGLSVKP
jgi:hypothetical protein